MSAWAYYNDIDKTACAVLREAIKEGIICDGEVDERSILDVEPGDLRGFRQHHFFAGAGIWSIAARMAGWPDEREICTASCPCQPFSVAGQQRADRDERDLWPALYRLISECRFPVLAGEQIAGSLGYQWVAGVRSQLEGIGYRVGIANLPAASVGAPHKRERLWWVAVADADRSRRPQLEERDSQPLARLEASRRHDLERCAVADADRSGHRGRPEDPQRGESRRDVAERADEPVGDAGGEGLALGSIADDERGTLRLEGAAIGAANPGGFWFDSVWLRCADGKARRVPRSEPGLRNVDARLPDGFEASDPSRLLIPSFPGRAEAWRLAGNAIVPQIAAQILGALMEIIL